jgi:hypothetical protein
MGILSALRTLCGGTTAPTAAAASYASPAVPSTPRSVYSDTGQPELLGPELARGGEGAVHLLANRPGVLVKLYFDHRLANDPELSAKVRAMTALPLKDDPRFAWPRMTEGRSAFRLAPNDGP